MLSVCCNCQVPCLCAFLEPERPLSTLSHLQKDHGVCQSRLNCDMTLKSPKHPRASHGLRHDTECACHSVSQQSNIVCSAGPERLVKRHQLWCATHFCLFFAPPRLRLRGADRVGSTGVLPSPAPARYDTTCMHASMACHIGGL